MARQLLVADRQFLLLRLRQATFGDRVRADLVLSVAGLRRSGCRMEFALADVPVEEAAEPGAAAHPDAFAAGLRRRRRARREVSFRLPNGADQEELSPLLAQNEAAA